MDKVTKKIVHSYARRRITLKHRLKAFLFSPVRHSLPIIRLNNSNYALGDTFITYPDGKRFYLLYLEKVTNEGILYRYYSLDNVPMESPLQAQSKSACVTGCKHFYGGEIKHHRDCPYYPESFSKRYDDLVIESEKMQNQLNQLKQ